MTQTVAIREESAESFEKPAEWPFVTEFYMVEGDDFLCMAYCDDDGVWRKAITHDGLPGDIRVLE